MEKGVQDLPGCLDLASLRQIDGLRARVTGTPVCPRVCASCRGLLGCVGPLNPRISAVFGAQALPRRCRRHRNGSRARPVQGIAPDTKHARGALRRQFLGEMRLHVMFMMNRIYHVRLNRHHINPDLKLQTCTVFSASFGLRLLRYKAVYLANTPNLTRPCDCERLLLK